MTAQCFDVYLSAIGDCDAEMTDLSVCKTEAASSGMCLFILILVV